MISTIQRPCIRQCCLDEKDVCVGCFRTLDEMRVWHKANIAEKDQILTDAKNRKKEHAKKMI